MCVDLWVGVPFKWRNFDTLPNTVDVRFVDVVVVVEVISAFVSTCTGFGLRNS